MLKYQFMALTRLLNVQNITCKFEHLERKISHIFDEKIQMP